jgi:pimeloyl-ACP methyl ester carboxylesterase/sugar phosphate isomerase/epimerase
MEYGIFARTLARAELAATLEAARAHGFGLVHFSFRAIGADTLPADLGAATCELIRHAFTAHSIRMIGVSATYNLIHPDRTYRTERTRRACRLIKAAPALGTSFVTLCTGTRDNADMWRRHPDNDSETAWAEMREEVDHLLEAAEEAEVTLGIEPEPGNTVSTAARARRLLDEVGSSRLAVILDPANLLPSASEAEAAYVLDQAFDLLADRAAVVHAKHLFDSGTKVDWARVGRLIDQYKLSPPVVIHDVPEPKLEQARTFLQHTLEPPRATGRLELDALTFSYRAEGEGEPILLLHGLGGDRWQALNLLPTTTPGRRIALDLRAHGDTHPIGPPDALTFPAFARDLHAFLDSLELPRAVLVGVSMGAGVALRFGLEHRHRVRALVLIRPAWIERPLTKNLLPFVRVGRLLVELGPKPGQRAFEESEQLRAIRTESNHAASSLLAQFTKPYAVERAPRLERMPASTPYTKTSQLGELDVPSLVICTPRDPLHPASFAKRWARALPQSWLRTVTSNDTNKPEHDEGIRQSAAQFLARIVTDAVDR